MKPGAFFVLAERCEAFRHVSVAGEDMLEMGDVILTVCESPTRDREVGCLTRFGFRWVIKNDIEPTF